jgi:ATP/maltotriose-dependent transcriptional regulator MalT/tRNA A-37 threonylcarbamoyl transferase component Bud32
VPGSQLTPRYQIARKLGQGGFGETYLARDESLDRPCVIKRLRLKLGWDDNRRQRYIQAFDREARMLAQINDPGQRNIPDIYDYLPGQSCLVMKYVAGSSLADQLRARGRLGLSEALGYTRDVCAALVYMHGRGSGPVLHRDVKPANILVDSQGRVWLIDFGLAHILPTTDDPSDAFASAGTWGYAPTEQLRGQAVPRSDVYALVATLYALLSGGPPPLHTFANHDPGPLRASLGALAPELPPQMLALLLRALAPAPAARPDAAELLAALDALIALRDLPAPAAAEPLPVQRELVGRAPDLAAYAGQLRDAHLALIVGPAGVGKTALASALASGWGDPARVFWRSLHPGDGPGDLLWELAGFLARLGVGGPWRLLHGARGGESPAPQVVLDYVVQAMRGMGCLLVLDDQHLAEASEGFSALVVRLVATARSGGLSLLLTSRQWPAGLDHAGAGATLAGLSAAAAAALLAQLGLALDSATAARLHAITEGNPQLMLLASDALRHTATPERLLDHLTEVDHIEAYLLGLVENQLDPAERRVMDALAVLLGYPARRAALQILIDDLQLRPILSELSRRQLLIMSGGGPERAYRQHALLQTFFYEQVPPANRRLLHARAATYYERHEGDWLLAARHALLADEHARGAALLADHAEAIIGRGQARALLALLDEIDQRALDGAGRVALWLAEGDTATPLRERERAAHAYSRAWESLERQPVTAARRAGLMRVCLGMGGLLEHENPDVALGWLRRGMAMAEADDTSAQARLQIGVGTALLGLSDWAGAALSLTRGLDLLPDAEGEWRAWALIALSAVAGSQGDLRRARQAASEALELRRRSGNLPGMIGALQNLALARELEGDYAGALGEYRQALDLAEQTGSVVHQVELRLNLGILRICQGADGEALDLLDHSYDLARRFDLQVQIVYIQASRGDLLLRMGRLSDARAALLVAWRRARRLAVIGQLPEISRGLALLRLAMGNPQRALRHAARAITAARAQDDADAEGQGLRVRGQILLATSDHAAALESFAASLALLSSDYERARTLALWGAALVRSDPDVGQAKIAEAQAIFARLAAR